MAKLLDDVGLAALWSLVKQKCEEVVVYSVGVSASWTADGTNGGYYQTIPVSGITAADNPCADVLLGSDVEANALYKEAWMLVDRITTANGSITLYANGEAPEVAFTVILRK